MDTDTKRHIDAARQVLVGVVPNPTSQIDQITYALIYKFMDDMDQAAIKNGDEPAFFVGDLEPYSWVRLMDTRIGNQERMNIYVVAFQKFTEAKQLPELFRNILKSASLPYRSPEVLGLFLKEINYFDYSHPEELGNAYEYLLSIMSSQGDAGQFRTPRHIIDFIVDVINPTKDDKVLDPACGTGGFLVSSYKHILEQHDCMDDPSKREKPLTPDERKSLMNNFEGYDIDPTMVRIAQVNMYLHQFKNPKIFQYDTLSMEERWNDKFDVIMANPPFMSPKGGIKPHTKFSIQSSRSEVLFVDYIMNHLRPNGHAGIIVPEGIIFQSGTAYRQLRKSLVEDGLYAVVSLPSGVFQPYSGVKTSILFFDKQLSLRTKYLLFVKIQNDGFDLGAQRRKIAFNDLPLALETLIRYQKHINSNGSYSLGGWPEGQYNIDTYPNCLIVSKEIIAKASDYNLSCDHYRTATDYTNAKWPMMELGSVCNLESGSRDKGGAVKNGIYSIGGEQISEDNEIRFEKMKYITEAHYAKMNKGILCRGDVLMVKDGATTGKMGYWNYDYKAAVNEHVYIFRAKDQILPKYLYNILLSDPFQHELRPYVKGIIGGISSEIQKIKIPLPPLEIQEQIVKELNGYTGIIAGAKQIAQNWKPKIDIDPTWKRVKIEDLVKREIIEKPLDGNHGNIHPKAKDYVQNGIPFIMANDLIDGTVDIKNSKKITEEQAEGLRKGFAKNGDVLLTHKGTIGRTAILNSEYDYVVLTPQVTYYRVINRDVLINKFLKSYFDCSVFQERLQQLASIGATRAYISITDQLNLEVLLPPLKTQKQIVEEIDVEHALIESAKKLIDIYEQKISDKIASLWN